MSVRIVERAVPASDESGEVGVRRAIFGADITVRWFCGDKRTFKSDQLASLIELLEILREHPDVWLEDSDINGLAFVARIVDGELYGDTNLYGDGRSIPWKPLKKALKKAMD